MANLMISLFWVLLFAFGIDAHSVEHESSSSSSELSVRFPKDTPLRTRLKGFTVGAHQGGIFHTDFNTIRRFEAARKEGVDIIELDLRITKDGVPVVYHDEELDTWTKCKGPVAEKTMRELRQCEFKFNDETIPLFEEVIAWSQGRVVINAEFKDKEVVESAVALVQKYHPLNGAKNWVYFQCKGDPGRYHRARKVDRDVALLMAPSGQDELNWSLSLQDDHLVVIELHDSIHTASNIAAIHKAGKLASRNSWHKSLTQEFFRATCTWLYKDGVDIAITNRPPGCIKQRNSI